MTCHCLSDRIGLFIDSFLAIARSLSLDFAILFDVDVVVGLERADLVIREFDAGHIISNTLNMFAIIDTHVKPFIRVNSCLISPPDDLAFSLALVSSSSLAFSFKVTCALLVSVTTQKMRCPQIGRLLTL